MDSDADWIDDVDRRILNALLADGRASIQEIADQVDVAVATVSKRLRRLEERDVVQGYAPVVAYDELGYAVTAIFHLDVRGPALPSVVDRIRARDRTIAVYEVTGSHDVVAIGRFQTTEELNSEIKALVTDPDVRSTNTSVALDVVREYEAFPLPIGDEPSAG